MDPQRQPGQLNGDAVDVNTVDTPPGNLPAQKIGEVKFYQCPQSVITDRTWEILKIVNRTTDGECNITMPFRGSSYEDQPAWYFQAVDIVRHARATHQRLKNG